jgi:hypothetical protein
MPAIGLCRHFRDLAQHKTCLAGVAYEEVRDPWGPAPKYPCHGNPKCLMACELRQMFTKAELEAEAQSFHEQMKRIQAALVKIEEDARKRPKPYKGQVGCPTCKGWIDYFIAPNGHIAAQCTTAGCVEFRQ